MVCNMGFKGGGHLKWSHSHNSGRDADLAFYMLRDGAPVDAPALVALAHEEVDLGRGNSTTLTLVIDLLIDAGMLEQARQLIDALRAGGFNQDEIALIAGHNWRRIFSQTWRA